MSTIRGTRRGRPLPLRVAAIEGAKIGLLSIVVYLAAVPFLLFAGVGVALIFLATAWLQGSQYFEFVAMRFHPAADAKACAGPTRRRCSSRASPSPASSRSRSSISRRRCSAPP